ncbi:hypothetical protein GE09DRAFT_359344 [Coniochaeta sp. 2T2.1]|nr:hypothetical protein GE09DRAFT_359344 [Coniochaeta sp. 2T2.1]
MGPSELCCRICYRSFTRHEHLQRHLLSHTEIRAFQCSFCSIRFNRRDALVRHWRTCQERLNSGRPIPSTSRQRRGRKQSSCDRCIQKKTRCSQTSPCDGCTDAGRECTYQPSLQTANEPNLETSPSTLDEVGELSLAPIRDPVPGAGAMSASVTSWSASVDQISQAGRGVDALFHRLVSAEDQSLDFLDLDCALELLPATTKHLSLDSKHWPAAARWNMDVVSVFGSPFGSYSHPKLTFLARFTSTDGIGNSFDCGDADQRRRIMLFLRQGRLHGQEIDKGPACCVIPQPVPLEHNFGPELSRDQVPGTFLPAWHKQQDTSSMNNTFQPGSAVHVGIQDWPLGDLSLRTQDIVLGIRDVVQHKSRKSPINITWSHSREMLCYRFFSPENLERFLLAFWAMWYPNWPVFHKPTFSAARKPATLLAAMALIGASLTTENSDHDQAMMWADAVEEWVFTDDNFNDGNLPRVDDEFGVGQIEARLDALRAAYAVILFLSWEGTVEQKKRARRIRFAQVIAVARSLQFSAATHENLDTYISAADKSRVWGRFILREELIRAMLFVFLLDCGYLIFNNSPPRMAAFELQCQLPCPEVCFQAGTMESWLQCIGIWSTTHIGRRQPLMSNIVEVVMEAHPSKEDWAMLQQMSSLNFFALTNIFHNLIFHHQCGATPTMEVPSISQGLQNWRRLWVTRQHSHGLVEPYPTDPRDAWKRSGFWRFAEEFWGLAYIIYKQPTYMQSLQRDGSQGLGGALRKGFLPNSDDSGMGQVHKLIMRFQDLTFVEELVAA